MTCSICRVQMITWPYWMEGADLADLLRCRACFGIEAQEEKQESKPRERAYQKGGEASCRRTIMDI